MSQNTPCDIDSEHERYLEIRDKILEIANNYSEPEWESVEIGTIIQHIGAIRIPAAGLQPLLALGCWLPTIVCSGIEHCCLLHAHL